MNVAVALLIYVGVIAVAVTLLALLRRRWPEGRIRVPQTYAGTTTAVSAVVGVLIAFVAGVALQSHNDARATVDDEAVALVSEHRLAGAIAGPPGLAVRFQGELVCYGRAVAALDWPGIAAGHGSAVSRRWGLNIQA